jgi:hypothetical protein
VVRGSGNTVSYFILASFDGPGHFNCWAASEAYQGQLKLRSSGDAKHKSESWSNYFGTRQGTVGAELHAEQAKNHLTDFFFLMKSAERASITCTPLYLIQSRGSLVVVTN